MEIYHGSYIEVSSPRILHGRYTKDFGTGFYCTLLRRQAERWAGKFDTPVLNIYDCVLRDSLKVLDFKNMTNEWLDFIVGCRGGCSHDYDIVIGAMADDQIYNYISDYISGSITREQFWVLAKFKYPTHQIAFCTDAALQCLTFQSSVNL